MRDKQSRSRRSRRPERGLESLGEPATETLLPRAGLATTACCYGNSRWASIETFLASQISKGSDISQAEGETEQVFIAQVGDGIAAVLEGDAAAVPVVCRLGGRKLEFLGLRVKSGAGSGGYVVFDCGDVDCRGA